MRVKTDGQLPADVLREAVALTAGDRFEEDALAVAAAAITRRCRDLGYPSAEVTVRTQVEQRAELDVLFEVLEGKPTRVRMLTVTGPAVISRPAGREITAGPVTVSMRTRVGLPSRTSKRTSSSALCSTWVRTVTSALG